MEAIGFATLVTTDGEKLRSRPMSARVDRQENEIHVLTHARRHKDEAIARNPNVNLAFADNRGRNYVSLTGRATASNNRAKIGSCSRLKRRHDGTAPGGAAASERSSRTRSTH